MTLFNTGSMVVQAGAGAPTKPGSFGELKASAATEFGGEGQQYYVQLAGKGLLKGIDVVNMRNLMRFGTYQKADANLVDTTAAYAVASGTFAIHEVQLIGTDGKVHRTLEYVPWGQFNSLEGKQTAVGTPEFWTARNLFEDQTVTLYPTPDAGAATDYDVRISYYTRISKPTLDSDVIDAPAELGEVLVSYAVYYMHRIRNKDKPFLIAEAKRRFDEQLAQFVESTEREPTETLQWVLAPMQSYPNRYDPLS